MRKILAVALLALFAPLSLAHAAPAKMSGKMMSSKKMSSKKMMSKKGKKKTMSHKMPKRDPKTGRFMKSSSMMKKGK